MAHSVRVRRSFLIWIFALLTAGACSTYSVGTYERPYFTRGGLLVLSSDYYMVRAEPGDTYAGLAREHNVSPYAVISLNEVKAPYRLRPGKLVRIPTPRIHVVRRGETLSGVAQAYHVDFYDLAQANALNSPYTIYPGQVLGLPSTGPVFKSPRKQPVHASFPPPHMEDSTGGREEWENRGEWEDRGGWDEWENVDPGPRFAGPDEMMPRPRPKPHLAETEQIAVLPRPKPHSAEATRIAVLPRPKPGALTAHSENAQGAGSVSESAGDMNELIWPVRGRILSGFGPTPNGRRNDGINIAVPEGTPVHAAADGVVIYCGNEVGGFGNLILVQHADDLVTAYAHTSEFKVEKGARVQKGQPIALSGSTGNVDQPQLHFEVRLGVKAVNPVEHLSA